MEFDLLKIEDSYLEDEVRDGFFISSMTKRAWAMELTVLKLIDTICQKYGIEYFADYGTYLGAVRHGGFVPWDDDIDICMKRNDYIKFINVAESELPNGYKILTFRNNDYTWKFLANVTPNDRMCFEPEYLISHYSFPYVVGVDIFVLDNVDEDYEEEKKRNAIIKRLFAVVDGCDAEISDSEYSYKTIKELNNPAIRKFFNYANNECGLGLNEEISYIIFKRKIYEKVEELISYNKDMKSSRLIQKIPWGTYHDMAFPSDIYDQSIRIPFEMIDIPVPIEYNRGLCWKYGENYMEIKMASTAHSYPYFEGQRERLGGEFEYPRTYKYDKEQVLSNKKEYVGSIKNISTEIILYLEECVVTANEVMLKFFSNNKEYTEQDIIDYFADIQQNMISYGELVERINNRSVAVISSIERYCEVLYNIASTIEKNVEECKSNLAKFAEITVGCIGLIKKEIIERRRVVFLSVREKYWSSFKSIYEKEREKNNTDVYVISIPYFYKEYNGALKNEINDDYYLLKRYVENVYKASEFDFSLLCPDVTYINNPYDEYNMSYAVAKEFYSSNIRKYTEKLIYIPFFKSMEFKRDQYQFWYNMKYYCTVPGVVFADEVLVQSENIKNMYVEKLEEWSATTDIWKKKIKVITDEYPDYECDYNNLPDPFFNIIKSAKKEGKNIKLWHLCTGIATDYRERFFNSIDTYLEYYENNKDKFFIILVADKYLIETIKNKRTDYIERLNMFLEKFLKSKVGIYANNLIDVEEYGLELAKASDSFLGCGSVMYKDFVMLGKKDCIEDMMM